MKSVFSQSNSSCYCNCVVPFLGFEHRKCPWRFPLLGDIRGTPEVPHQLAAVGYQVHQWASSGSEGWSEENLRPSYTGTTWVLQPATVETYSLWCCFLTHHRTREEKVWTNWMEHSVRVQPVRFHGYSTVCAEPSWWHRSQEGRKSIYFYLILSFYFTQPTWMHRSFV